MELRKQAAELLTVEQQEFILESVDGRDILFMSIHGSHLYGLNREGSDFDIKAIYIPSKEDMLLGKALKTYNKKCDKLDIEIEVKSLPSYLNSALKADTNCIDLLHTPESLVLRASPIWYAMKQVKSELYSKDMKGLVGYIKTHTHKYNNKIHRFEEITDLRAALDNLPAHYWTIGDVAESNLLKSRKYKYIKTVTQVSDHEQKYLEVCGKKHLYKRSISELVEVLDSEIKRYGERTKNGSDKDLDTKSLSHALRVLMELEEILRDNTVTFPLKEREYALRVKLGEVPLDSILTDIDNRYERCMLLIEECGLPEKSSIDKTLSIAKDYIF
ncbi:MAG: hypothetical protein GY822_01660 [Deltaproteobacteria bacterium]|nr:hypothetical protein [Deltaproteobacteria bacterium]